MNLVNEEAVAFPQKVFGGVEKYRAAEVERNFAMSSAENHCLMGFLGV